MLTIIIITNRADQRFVDALASAQFADQVLIVDHQSGANWKELKDRFHFYVIKEDKPIENFSKVRNEALQHAKGDWVFFLDSDEVIPQPLQQEMREVVESTEVFGASIQRRDYFLGKPLHFGEVKNMILVRLVKKGHGKWQGKIHETLTVDGKISTLQMPLQHFPHSTISAFITKVSWYAKLRAEEISSTSHFSLMQTLTYPLGKFMYNFLWKQGFRDSWPGLIYAVVMSIHSLAVRVYVYEKQQQHKAT